MYDKAVSEVNETFNFYMSMLAERKLEVVKELEKSYSTKQHYVTLPIFNSPTVAQLVPYDGGYFSYSSGQFWTILVMRPNLT